jgi:hypothetical protein
MCHFHRFVGSADASTLQNRFVPSTRRFFSGHFGFHSGRGGYGTFEKIHLKIDPRIGVF